MIQARGGRATMPPRKRPDISPAPPRRCQRSGRSMHRRSGLPDATSPSPGPAFPLPRSRGKTAVQGPCGKLAGSAHGAFGQDRRCWAPAILISARGDAADRSQPALRRPGQPEPEKSGRAHRLSWRFPPRSVGGGGVGGRTAESPQSRARLPVRRRYRHLPGPSPGAASEACEAGTPEPEKNPAGGQAPRTPGEVKK